jgi:hypothetical protein
MNEKTKQFLKRCQTVGYNVIAIDRSTSLIPKSIGWGNPLNNVFAFPETSSLNTSGEHQWPYIWKLCEEFKIEYGCGNSDQHQIKSQHGLNSGVYILTGKSWAEIHEKQKCIDIDDLPFDEFPNGAVIPKCNFCIHKHEVKLLGNDYTECKKSFKKL